MHPADFYALVSRDRPRAVRHLLCYDGPGLWQLAEACAHYLAERFEVHIPPDHVLAAWQRTALLGAPQAAAALRHQERMVGA